MRLHDPWLLVLLLLVPVVAWLAGGRTLATVRYPATETLRVARAAGRARLRWISPLLVADAFGLLVVALARPQLGKANTRVVTSGIDIMLVVDVSGSMLAEDFNIDQKRVNRLTAVRRAVGKFLDGREGDRAGLVLFASKPYLQSPLTLDHGWLQQNLARARVGMIEDGTAIGSALAAAVGHLDASDAESKVVVLLTDGVNNTGRVSPLQAAEAAAALGFKVYTIGAGTKGLAPYPAVDVFGNRVFQPVPVEIDEDTLREVSRVTGGLYFRATDTDSLDAIYAEIDRLEKSEYEGLRFMEYRELYMWLLVPALLLLALEAVLSETWLRVLP